MLVGSIWSTGFASFQAWWRLLRFSCIWDNSLILHRPSIITSGLYLPGRSKSIISVHDCKEWWIHLVPTEVAHFWSVPASQDFFKQVTGVFYFSILFRALKFSTHIPIMCSIGATFSNAGESSPAHVYRCCKSCCFAQWKRFPYFWSSLAVFL